VGGDLLFSKFSRQLLRHALLIGQVKVHTVMSFIACGKRHTV
jgi:hypothetical protein